MDWLQDEPTPRGLLVSIVFGYGNVRKSARNRLCTTRRHVEIFGWLIFAGSVICFGLLLRDAARSSASNLPLSNEAMITNITSSMLGALVFVPVLVYLLAIPTWLILHYACRGGGDYKGTVVAASWAALLGSPVHFAGSLAGAGIAYLPVSHGTTDIGIRIAELAAFLFALSIWAKCICEAHGLSRDRIVFWSVLAAMGTVLILVSTAESRPPGGGTS